MCMLLIYLSMGIRTRQRLPSAKEERCASAPFGACHVQKRRDTKALFTRFLKRRSLTKKSFPIVVIKLFTNFLERKISQENLLSIAVIKIL